MHAPAARSIVRRLVALAVALFGLASIGCGGDFDPVSRILDLRVIAVQADSPYAKPGEKVHLTSLWFDPQTRVREWAWVACVDPDDTTVLGCLEKIAQDVENTHTSPTIAVGVDLDTFDVTVPTDALSRLPDDARANATVGVITIVCPGQIQVDDFSQFTQGANPVHCLDPATGEDLTTDRYVIGIKRIFVRQTDRNANPKVAKVTWDGADWAEDEVKTIAAVCDTTGNRFSDCDGAEQHSLSLVLTSDSDESGTDESGNSFTEQLIVQYYATEGLFKDDVKLASDPGTSFVARDQSKGQLMQMWFVGRDDRGGVVWTQRKVQVLQPGP